MNIANVKAPLPGPKGKKLLQRWHEYEADVVGFQAPVVWDTARGCVVTDVDGNTYELPDLDGLYPASRSHLSRYF